MRIADGVDDKIAGTKAALRHLARRINHLPALSTSGWGDLNSRPLDPQSVFSRYRQYRLMPDSGPELRLYGTTSPPSVTS